MDSIKTASDELFRALIKSNGINFRGIKIGDNLDTLILKEGKPYKDIGGSLPNYKYFQELGEMEELELVYAYKEATKHIYNIQLKLITYPKYYWEKAGGTDEIDLLQQISNNALDQYIEHFLLCKKRIIDHFEEQLGPPEIDYKDFVFKHPHQNFVKYVWVSEGQRLTIKSYLDDLDTYRKPLTMQLYLILSDS